MFFTCLLYLTIGPFFAIPRCATTSFTVGLEQMLPENDHVWVYLFVFTFVFFVHTLHLSTEVQGVLFGLLRTPYWAYVGGSMAALIPSMLIYTVIGDKFDFTNPLFWAFVALDALTVVFGFVYAKKNLIDGGKKASEE